MNPRSTVMDDSFIRDKKVFVTVPSNCEIGRSRVVEDVKGRLVQVHYKAHNRFKTFEEKDFEFISRSEGNKGNKRSEGSEGSTELSLCVDQDIKEEGSVYASPQNENWEDSQRQEKWSKVHRYSK